MQRTIIVIFLVFCVHSSLALKITKFEVPSVVVVGETARLVCEYELAPYRNLYTLRWLRNNVEFYRYDPALTPRHNFYKTHGLHVKVVFLSNEESQMRKSNGSRLYIDHVSEEDVEGTYTCEVTTFPNFTRVSESKRMEVVPHSNVDQFKKDHEAYHKGSHRRGRQNGGISSIGSYLLITTAIFIPSFVLPFLRSHSRLG